MHTLIDGDQFVFLAAVTNEEEVRWDEQNHVLYSNEEKVWRTLHGMLERVFKRFEYDGHTICFSGQQPYFREALATNYKAERRRSRKPLCYRTVRNLVENTYNCVSYAGLEADDVMGILATSPGTQWQPKPVVVSHDKDMKTVPCTVWDGEDVVIYSETEADYWHLFQTLVGDRVDGYAGCPGVGPVKAKKLLQDAIDRNAHLSGTVYHCCWPTVVAAYEKSGMTEQDALTQARLARILRWTDWDAKKKEPILWGPPV